MYHENYFKRLQQNEQKLTTNIYKHQLINDHLSLQLYSYKCLDISWATIPIYYNETENPIYNTLSQHNYQTLGTASFEKVSLRFIMYKEEGSVV